MESKFWRELILKEAKYLEEIFLYSNLHIE